LSPITVIIVDDHPLIREGIFRILQSEKNIQIIGAAGSCAETRHLLAKNQPDVLILDLQLPDGSGLNLSVEFKNAYPDLKIVILTGYMSQSDIKTILRFGVQGVVLKEEAPEVLCQAVLGAKLDGIWLSEHSRLLLAQRQTNDFTSYNLTPREMEVIKLLARGKTDTEIAVALEVTSRTIRSYLHNIMEKFGLNSRTQLILKVINAIS
jgi:DNA-binding NarL/FixJ family response regulator